MTGIMAVSSPEVVMTSSTKTEAPAQPVFERLPVDPFVACDGHASQAIQALVTMLTPEGHEVYLCGNCARKTGHYEHTADGNRVDENRHQGSDH